MSTKTAATKYELNTVYVVNPDECIIREDLRGRSKPVSEAKIRSLAESICESGQLHPALARPNADNKLEIIFGFSRHGSVKLAIDEKMPNAPTGLRVQIVDMTDQAAVLANIAENKRRNETNAVDDAINIQRMMSFGLKQREIAQKLELSEAWVSGLKGLVKLTPEEQQLVIDKKCTAAIAVELAKLSQKKRKEALKFATTKDGLVDDMRMREWQRLQIEDSGEGDSSGGESGDGGGSEGGDGEGTPRQATGSKARKPKEIREFFVESSEAVDWPLPIRDFTRQVVRWLDGKITNNTLTKKMEQLIYDNMTDEAKNTLEASATEGDEAAAADEDGSDTSEE